MNKKIKYSDGHLSMGERVKDFLPSPSQITKIESAKKPMRRLSEDKIKSKSGV